MYGMCEEILSGVWYVGLSVQVSSLAQIIRSSPVLQNQGSLSNHCQICDPTCKIFDISHILILYRTCQNLDFRSHDHYSDLEEECYIWHVPASSPYQIGHDPTTNIILQKGLLPDGGGALHLNHKAS